MRTVLPLCLLALLPTALAQAQNQGAVELTRQEIQTERQAIVAHNLPLTPEQDKAFWPVYREYRAEMAPVGDRTVALLTDFAKKYDSLNDADAEKLLKEFISVQQAKLKVQSKYVDRFKKVIPPKSVARFYQIENKLDAIIAYQMADQIPLVK